MPTDPYPVIMLALATVIAALSLLLAALERRPPPGPDQLGPGGWERRDEVRRAAAAQRVRSRPGAVRNRRGKARRRGGLDARHREAVLGGGSALLDGDSDAGDELAPK